MRGTHSKPEVYVSRLLDLCLRVECVVELEQGLDRLRLGGLVVELILLVRRRLAGSLLVSLRDSNKAQHRIKLTLSRPDVCMPVHGRPRRVMC